MLKKSSGSIYVLRSRQMMGHRTKRFKLFTETNLEALLPADNFYRPLPGKQMVIHRRPSRGSFLYYRNGRWGIEPTTLWEGLFLR